MEVMCGQRGATASENGCGAEIIEDANETLGTKSLVSEVLFNHVSQPPVQVRRAQTVLKGKRATFAGS